jgi:GTP 3',8-cyclase
MRKLGSGPAFSHEPQRQNAHMPQRFIPLHEVSSPTSAHQPAQALTLPHQPWPMGLDALQRPLRDLRISVTDRCNFRCGYCMPRSVFGAGYTFLPTSELLSFEEITRSARLLVGLGVQKIRLTGGEPLLRKNLEKLIAMLSALRTTTGQTLDLSLTTNASLLARKAQALKDAGLQRLTVSLDALDEATFRRMNDADFSVAQVLAGIDAAQQQGFTHIKVNMVVQRGVNDFQIEAMARHFRGSGVVLRFIEFMDVGRTNGWRLDQVVPSAQVLERLSAVALLEPLEPHTPSETAQRWRFKDGSGEIGLISSVSRAFCRNCTRLRLSTQGRLYLCLFAQQGHDLRALLRSDCADDQIQSALACLWSRREDRYSELRSVLDTTGVKPVEMHYIGG